MGIEGGSIGAGTSAGIAAGPSLGAGPGVSSSIGGIEGGSMGSPGTAPSLSSFGPELSIGPIGGDMTMNGDTHMASENAFATAPLTIGESNLMGFDRAIPQDLNIGEFAVISPIQPTNSAESLFTPNPGEATINQSLDSIFQNTVPLEPRKAEIIADAPIPDFQAVLSDTTEVWSRPITPISFQENATQTASKIIDQTYREAAAQLETDAVFEAENIIAEARQKVQPAIAIDLPQLIPDEHTTSPERVVKEAAETIELIVQKAQEPEKEARNLVNDLITMPEHIQTWPALEEEVVAEPAIGEAEQETLEIIAPIAAVDIKPKKKTYEEVEADEAEAVGNPEAKTFTQTLAELVGYASPALDYELQQATATLGKTQELDPMVQIQTEAQVKAHLEKTVKAQAAAKIITEEQAKVLVDAITNEEPVQENIPPEEFKFVRDTEAEKVREELANEAILKTEEDAKKEQNEAVQNNPISIQASDAVVIEGKKINEKLPESYQVIDLKSLIVRYSLLFPDGLYVKMRDELSETLFKTIDEAKAGIKKLIQKNPAVKVAKSGEEVPEEKVRQVLWRPSVFPF